MGRPISRLISPNGLTNVRCIMFAAHVPSTDAGQDRALASDAQEPHPVENYYLPGALEAKSDALVEYYNHHRYHESLSNLTSADVFGRGHTILLKRDRIK